MHIVAGKFPSGRTLFPEAKPVLDKQGLLACLYADVFDWRLRGQFRGHYHALKLLMLYTGERTLASLRYQLDFDRHALDLEPFASVDSCRLP